MIDQFKRTVIADLYKLYGIGMVDADNNRRQPKRPYATIKTLTELNAGGQAGNYSAKFVESADPQFKYDIKERLDYQPTATLSLTAIADTEQEARQIAGKMSDYFKFVGRPRLDEINIVIVDVGDVGDRTALFADDITHDYMYGLDIRIRYLRNIERQQANIERWKATGEIGRIRIEQEKE